MSKFIIATDGNFQDLAEEIASGLNDTEVVQVELKNFSDGEHTCEYLSSLRGKVLFLVASTSHDDLIQTLLLIDAAKRAAADKIVLVTPCLGYARQDRKEGIRGPLGSKLVADMLQIAGINELVVVDLHAQQIQGFYNIPIDNLEGHTIFTPTLEKLIMPDRSNWVICTPDAGGFVRASKFAKNLELSIVAINKHRDKPNSIGSMELVGDVTGKKVIIVDDMVDTAGTLSKASNYLLENGALEVHAVCTHAILSGKAVENLKTSNLKHLYVTNSNINPRVFSAIKDLGHLVFTISLAKKLKQAISAIQSKSSMNVVNVEVKA